MPECVGDAPGRSLFIQRNICRLMRSDSWERFELSGLYLPCHRDGCDPVTVCQRIVARGGGVHPDFVVHGGSDATTLLPLLRHVHPAADSGVGPTDYVLLDAARTMKGQRLQLFKALWAMYRTSPVWREVAAGLPHSHNVAKFLRLVGL